MDDVLVEDEFLDTLDAKGLKEFLELMAMFDEEPFDDDDLDESFDDDRFDYSFDEDEHLDQDFSQGPLSGRTIVQFSTDDIVLPEPVPRPDEDTDAKWDEWRKKRLAQKNKIVGRRNGEITVDGMNQEEFRTYFMALCLEMNTDSYTLLERLIDYSFGFGPDNLFQSYLTKVIARAGDDKLAETAEKMISRTSKMNEDELDRMLISGALFRKDLQSAGQYLQAVKSLSTSDHDYPFYLSMKMVYEAARKRYTPARKIGQEILNTMKKNISRFVPTQMVKSLVGESPVYVSTDFLIKVMNYRENPNPHLKKQINQILLFPAAEDLLTMVYFMLTLDLGDLLESDMLEPDNKKRFLRFYKSEQTTILLQRLVDQASKSDDPVDVKELNAYLKEIEPYENMRESYVRAADFFESHGMEKEAKAYWRKVAKLPCDREMSDLEVRSDVNQRFRALQRLDYKDSTFKKYLRESEKELQGNREGLAQLDLVRYAMHNANQ